MPNEVLEAYDRLRDLACVISFLAFAPDNDMHGGNTVSEVKDSLCNLLNLPPNIYENIKNGCEKNISNNGH